MCHYPPMQALIAHRPSHLIARLTALLLLVAAMLVIAVAASPVASEAQAATKCSLSGKDRKLGPTYTTKLSVSGTSCKAGYSLVTAYYKCRTKAGSKSGRCTKKVSGYSCQETRENVIDTQFDATVTCKKSKATITHGYTQYT